LKKLLIIRFSALGDVAMLVPVVQQLAAQYPELDITVLSRKQTAPLWTNLPEQVHFYGADLKGRHHGTNGLRTLLSDIDYKQFDMVADMHNVLRSRFLCRRLRLAGKKVASIHKGHWQKWLLVHRHHHIGKLVTRTFPTSLPNSLPTTISRYQQVLLRLGFRIKEDISLENAVNTNQRKHMGIAPFAAHQGKIYPLEKMEEVVRIMSEYLSKRGENIYLFGAGDKEKAVLEDWEGKYQNVISLVGKQKMDQEIEIMRGLRLMLTMDSGNMHLASLAHTRVLSIWGATHPRAGFLGYGQDINDCIQLSLPCRPCSIYGNKPCAFGDYRCLNIEPSIVAQKIMQTYE